MNRLFSIIWLVLVVLAAAYLGHRLIDGLNFRTDITALLPREERDEHMQRATDAATLALSQRIVILVGDTDREKARVASEVISKQLVESGTVTITANKLGPERMKAIGALYFPYRHGLLTSQDRQLLQARQGQAIATRAISQVYGLIGMANGSLLRSDPFMLIASYFMGLPTPASRLTLDDGLLSLKDQNTTWIMIAGQVNGDPYALDVQKKLIVTYETAVTSAKTAAPDLKLLHVGAIFFAKAGAEQAMCESSVIGVVSTIGTIILILLAFRSVAPLALSLLVIGVGVLVALSVSLLLFKELHIGALLFGTSLIGVAVDYSLQYCTEIFTAPLEAPSIRLKRVFVGITLGMLSTVIGYVTLMLAPFPGLHQIAVFSTAGLIASWLTVVLWLPALDCATAPTHGARLLAWAGYALHLWEDARYHRMRQALVMGLIALSIIGALVLRTDDNVRHMQSLAGPLMAEQEKIQELIGSTNGSQFFMVQAPSEELALQQEELLVERLSVLKNAKALAGYQAPSQYVPSAKRQRENRLLVREQLYVPFLAAQQKAFHLQKVEPLPADEGAVLTLADATSGDSPFSFLNLMLLKTDGIEATHVVLLDGIADQPAVRQAAAGLQGVRFVDPAGDFSALLEKYRYRALWLVALSALFIALLLIWRYGVRRAFWVFLPPMMALIATPALRALGGGVFTFFDAMALVLILSIGVDYTLFCAETSQERRVVTFLAVTMAAAAALMAFGLLAFSQALAVHNFGATMAIGIFLSFILSPLARRAAKNH